MGATRELILVLLAIYTAALMFLSYRTRQKHGTGGFFDGQRSFSAPTIFILVTALWTSSSIAVELDTGFASGWAAIWLGVATALLSVLVAFLAPLFQRLGYTSNSALLGDVFGRGVRRFSGLVIGITFPIFAMSNVLFAGYFLHALLGWPLWGTLAVTTAVLILVVQFAGLRSLAAVQGLNLAMMLAGLLVLASVMHHVALPSASTPPPIPVPPALVLVWLSMNLLNVLSAQVEFQAVVAARNIKAARTAVWLSAGVLGAVAILATWIGDTARSALGVTGGDGLAAVSQLVVHHGSPIAVVVIALGVWALALTWSTPLLFSGAVSLGRDVIGQRLRWTKLALAIEGALMVGFALWRPGELAWWSVFGLTLRNAGVVGPTIAALIWRNRISPKWVLAAMAGGIFSGLGLNAITGFSAVHFVWNINPMWISQTVALWILAAGRWHAMQERTHAVLWAVASGASLAFIATGPWIPDAVRGVALLIVASAWLAFTAAIDRRRAHQPYSTQDRRATAV